MASSLQHAAGDSACARRISGWRPRAQSRRAGFRYLLVPTGKGGNAPLGNMLMGNEAEWGMELAGEAGRFSLYRVK